MADDEDETAGEAPLDPTFATAGPRRSTFTPPPASVQRPAGDGVHDDDALADALAEEFTRLGSGTINLPPLPPDPSTVLEPDEPAAAEPAAAEPSTAPVFQEPGAPVSQPPAYEAPVETFEPATPAFEAPAPEQAPVFDAPAPEQAPVFDAPAPEPAPPADQLPPPWVSAPAPDPSQAVSLEGPFEPPQRRSLPDDELLRWVDEAGREPGGTLNVIEQLETQLRLREEEAREFQAWESRMHSLGTPEAETAIETARPEFTGGLPSVPVPAGFPPPEPEAFVPPEVAGFPPAEAEPAVAEPEPEPALPAFGAPDIAAFPPPAPETFVAPEDAVADWPPPAFEREDEPVAEAEPFEEPGPAAHGEPPPVLPAWEIPAPSESWSPPEEQELVPPAAPEPRVPSFDDLFAPPAEDLVERPVYDLDDAPEPDASPFPFAFGAPPAPVPPPVAAELPGEPEPAALLEPETLVEPELELEPEPAAMPEPEPVATPEPDPESAFAPPAFESVVEATLEPDTGEQAIAEPDGFIPPPLVEPPPFGGPPILPSQAAAMPPLVLPPDLDEREGDDDAGMHSFDFGFGPPIPPSSARSPEPEPVAPQDDFIDPLPVAAGEPIPTDTGTVTIIDQELDRDLEDDVDETDRVTGAVGLVAIDADGNAVLPEPIHPPSGPISTVRIPDDELVLLDNEPTRLPVFSIEPSGPEPTPVDHRVGRAARLFWLWFAANSSVLSLGLGAAVFAVGMSLRQSIVAILAGVALSFIPLGLTTLAGKRSGQPTMIVSRATFGVLGNALPAALAFVTRLFWGAAMLWLLSSAVAIVLVGAELEGALGEGMLMLLSLGIAFVLAVVVAVFGYPLLARIQLVLSVVSGALVVGLIAMTAPYVNFENALTTPDGPWLLTVSGAVLVFSFVGLAWANSGADLARYQRPGSSGAASMLWATFGATLPAFLLIGYGALLAASNEGVASGFLQSPLDTLALMLPTWYPVPLLAAAALSLLSGVTVVLYSGGFALQAIGVRLPRQFGVLVSAALLGLLALVFTFAVPGGILELFADVATTVAVPTAAWAGIFAAETMIRNRRFESESLVRRGGVYQDFRWVNVIALIVISILGFALTTATVGWLSWQGFGFSLLGLPLDGDVARTDLGVLVALVLGLLTPIVAGIPAIRRQEATKL